MHNLTPQKRAGQKLRALIAENYDSQEDFAFDIGYDVRTVSRYVNNGIYKIDVVQDLADHFGVRFEDFFDREEDDEGPS